MAFLSDPSDPSVHHAWTEGSEGSLIFAFPYIYTYGRVETCDIQFLSYTLYTPYTPPENNLGVGSVGSVGSFYITQRDKSELAGEVELDVLEVFLGHTQHIV